MANIFTNEAVVNTGGKRYHLLYTSNPTGSRTWCGLTDPGQFSVVSGARPGGPFEYFTRVCKTCTRAAQACGKARVAT